MSITEIAYHNLTDKDKLISEFSKPDKVLRYLEDNKNFKSLSMILKEIMVKSGLCNEMDSDRDFVKKLYESLKAQNISCSEKTVGRWINGETRSLKNREVAIGICFALHLDISLAETLLNKCGYTSFNIRNVMDAIYMYCIISGQSLAKADLIMESFKEQKKVNMVTVDTVQEDSGNTTIMLKKMFQNSNWDNDDSFLSTFLVPNKDNFIGYSKTAVNEYYKWKNILWYIIIHDAIMNETVTVPLYAHWVDIPTSDMEDHFPVMKAFKSAIAKFQDINSTVNNETAKSLYGAYKDCFVAHSDIEETLERIRKIMNDARDLDSQKTISVFFEDIISKNGLIVYAIGSFMKKRGSKDGELLNKTSSSLKESVMKEFPYDDEFMEFENDYSRLDTNVSVRKIIMLMYYISYAYEFSAQIDSLHPNSGFFGKLGFREFMSGLNEVLSKCNQPTIYPPTQFDFLILRSILEFEGFISADDYNGEPLDFFSKVIAFSFDIDLEDF